MPDFDVLSPMAGQPSGILAAFDPTFQAKQAQAALAQQQVKQATLFSGGLPTDANGNTDWNAAYSKAMQAGAYDLANQLVGTGIRMASLNDRSTLDDPTGQGAGGTSPRGGALSQLLPAAGGGMIAPGVGGDDYGRMPGGGYAGVGQVGAGGLGISATGRPAAGPGAASPNGGAGGLDPLDAYAHSVGSIESGNNYSAVGPTGKSGAAPLGRYQVMSSNVGPWTKEVLGQAMSPADFLASPQAQDAVFRAKFGQAVQQYGNPFDAASVWFSGKPLNRAGSASDSLGTTVPDYVRRFAAGLAPAAAALRGSQGAGQPAAGAQVAQGGMQGAPISFNGPTAPAAGAAPAAVDPQTAARQRLAAQDGVDLSTLTPEQAAQRDADVDAATSVSGSPASAAPVSDADVSRARALLQRVSGYDPASLAPQVQQAVATAKATVGAYLRQQNAPTSQDPTAAPPDEPVVTNKHPYAPGGGGMMSPPATPARPAPSGAPAGYRPTMSSGAGGGLPISFGAPGAGVGGGGAPQLGAVPAAPLAPPTVGAAPASTSGPDLPNLPAGFQDPGGGTRYVNAVLAKAAQFAAAGDPRAKVWEERAKQVQDQLTAAQTFRNNLALAQARADDRYNAANSPGAIAAAGAKAGEEAAARNRLTLVPSVQPDGSVVQIPQSDAVTAAQNGRPIVSAQPGYVTQGQGNLLAKLLDGSKAYQERQVASQRLDALSSLLETYQTGANSTAFNEAAANAKSLGIPVPTSATLNPAAMQEFTKNGYANVLSSMKEQGNKQYAAEVQAAVNSNPNPDLQPEANAAMIAQMQGTKRWYDQNFRDYASWYHSNKGASDDADFQTSWTDAHPLGAYVVAAGKDIAPTGIAQPAPGKLVDGQAYMTAGGKMRWSASAGRMVPFSGTTAPALGGQSGGPPTASRNPPSSTAPVQGARQARDGNWYVADPNRLGKFLMVSR